VAFDPEQRLEADAELVGVGEVVVVRVASLRPASAVARRSLTLVQALSKGTKVDAVVRDATELGATRVVPVLTARCVKRRGNVERWRRVALEAARQCGRGDVPLVTDVTELSTALAGEIEGAAGVLLHPEADASLADAVGDGPMVVVVGPEGGFTKEELEQALGHGYAIASLGTFVLRTETACAAALGAILALSR